MTTSKARRQMARDPRPTFFVDEFGILCARVPVLHADRPAILWAEDYHRIKQAGVSNHWQLNDNGKGRSYVRAYRPGLGRVTIARLVVAEDGEYRWVRYVNGDRLDLRRPNLALSEVPEDRHADSREAGLFKEPY